MKKFLGTLIFIIALICFCVSAFFLGRYAYQTWKTNQGLASVSEKINTDVVVPDAASDDSGNTDETVDESELMMEKYGAIYEENHDFIGWLSIPDTPIDYPVMYTPDYPQFYLRKNFNHDYDIGGMIFVDERCSFDPVSTDIIIYGHKMKNATMFGPLGDYKEEDFWKDHKTVYFDTLYRSGTYEVFTAFLSKAYDGEDTAFKYYDFIDAETEEDFNSYIDNIKSIALYYDEDSAPKFGDEIITLSTCDYYTDDGRFAVLARRVK